jgi:chromate transporter
VAGLLGAGLTTWVTFVPCFLWVFTFAPWIEWLQQSPRLKGGLAAVTASVVGVIANLTVWFAIHVLFARTTPFVVGPLHLVLPAPDNIQPVSLAITIVALIAILGFRLPVMPVLAICAALGLAQGALSGSRP